MSQLRFALIRFFLCISFGFDVDLGAAGAIGIIPLYIGKDIDRERGEKNEKKKIRVALFCSYNEFQIGHFGCIKPHHKIRVKLELSLR